ncbi:hypothetical protein EVAR_33839_1 [Eumeta japonica]|uniref:Uncharacterized protein n=1 Tax=Eumeta variegata TaxID=151549 RepID=A0A4C1VAD7_EUMVA|nr:hypothetical protein EVAR_33839_1 [Eumeta japonica]
MRFDLGNAEAFGGPPRSEARGGPPLPPSSFIRDAKGQQEYSGKPTVPALINAGKAIGYLSNDWCKAVIVLLYKGKDSRQMCNNLKKYECGLRMDELSQMPPVHRRPSNPGAVGVWAAGDGN